MNCELFQTSLHDWLDGGLDVARVGFLQAHCDLCPECVARLAAERNLRSALRQLPVAAARPRFASQAIQVARLADRIWGRRLRRHDLQIATVAASIAFAACAVALLRGVPDVPAQTVTAAPAQLQTYALTAGQVQSLRLRIEAPRDIDSVQFSVELPEHVALAGQPGIRAMTWEGSLRKGPNVLELPLLAQVGAAGRVATRVSWGEFERHLEAALVSVPPLSGVRGRSGGEV